MLLAIATSPQNATRSGCCIRCLINPEKPVCRPGHRNVSSFPAVVPTPLPPQLPPSTLPAQLRLVTLGTELGTIWLLTRMVLNIRTQCPGSSRCASTDTRWTPCAPSGQSWPVDRFHTIAKPVRCSFCVTVEYEHVFDVLTFTSTPHDASRRWPKNVPRPYST
jgi:hypothetical protein